MNTQQQHNVPQNYGPEIDLIDLVAVLWRRKGIVIAVSALVVVAWDVLVYANKQVFGLNNAQDWGDNPNS